VPAAAALHSACLLSEREAAGEMSEDELIHELVIEIQDWKDD